MNEHVQSDLREEDAVAVVDTAADAPALEMRDVTCGYGGQPVLSGVSLTLAPRQVLSLLGPNGVGKTTLFKTLLGFIPAISGTISVQGRDTSEWSRREFAREIAYIPQLHMPNFAFSVHDVVLMGRTPHLDLASTPSESDDEIARSVMEHVGIEHLSQRDYTSLSGGERQMVLIARALAQQPRILVMDEPCASLDFGNQARLLDTILDLADDGMAVVMTTHDPNHAFLLDGEVICLGGGKVMSHGKSREVLTDQTMESLYGVPVDVTEGNACNCCIPRLQHS